jgi:hypothetical protein
MSRKRIVLRISKDSWSAQCFGANNSIPRQSRLELCPSYASPASVVEALERVISAPKTFTYTLLLDSPSVFVSRFPADELGGTDSRQTLAFRFEEALPVNAEDLICDFVLPKRKRGQSSQSIVALGTLRGRVLELIDSFRNHGLQIDSVLPETLLLAQTAITAFSLPQSGCVLVPNTSGFDAVVWDNGSLLTWRHGLSPSHTLRDLQLLFGELESEFGVFVLSREDSVELVEALPPNCASE